MKKIVILILTLTLVATVPLAASATFSYSLFLPLYGNNGNYSYELTQFSHTNTTIITSSATLTSTVTGGGVEDYVQYRVVTSSSYSPATWPHASLRTSGNHHLTWYVNGDAAYPGPCQFYNYGMKSGTTQMTPLNATGKIYA